MNTFVPLKHLIAPRDKMSPVARVRIHDRESASRAPTPIVGEESSFDPADLSAKKGVQSISLIGRTIMLRDTGYSTQEFEARVEKVAHLGEDPTKDIMRLLWVKYGTHCTRSRKRLENILSLKSTDEKGATVESVSKLPVHDDPNFVTPEKSMSAHDSSPKAPAVVRGASKQSKKTKKRKQRENDELSASKEESTLKLPVDIDTNFVTPEKARSAHSSSFQEPAAVQLCNQSENNAVNRRLNLDNTDPSDVRSGKRSKHSKRSKPREKIFFYSNKFLHLTEFADVDLYFEHHQKNSQYFQKYNLL
jgi:hypothetical protein